MFWSLPNCPTQKWLSNAGWTIYRVAFAAGIFYSRVRHNWEMEKLSRSNPGQSENPLCYYKFSAGSVGKLFASCCPINNNIWDRSAHTSLKFPLSSEKCFQSLSLLFQDFFAIVIRRVNISIHFSVMKKWKPKLENRPFKNYFVNFIIFYNLGIVYLILAPSC